LKFSFSASGLTISFFTILFLTSAYCLFCEIKLSSLSESFEDINFPPSGWTKVNVATGSTGWERRTLGENPVPGFNYGNITVPPGGGNAVAFCNYLTGGTNSNDEWLITSQLTNIQTNDSLIFWLRKFGAFTDHLDIKISTTNPTPSAMTISIAALSFNSADSGWIQYKYRIGSLVTQSANIYIGFRQWVSSTTNQGASFSLDLVRKTGPIGIQEIDLNEPRTTRLNQNFPNPFNPSTTISYELKSEGNVELTIYSANGEEITILVNENQNAGIHYIVWKADRIASGVYYYRLTTDGYAEVKKMLLIK
jgi:hypothetical protein